MLSRGVFDRRLTLTPEHHRAPEHERERFAGVILAGGGQALLARKRSDCRPQSADLGLVELDWPSSEISHR